MRPPSVTAVIPTVGRDSLKQAIRSVEGQKGVDGPIELIVVADTPTAQVPDWVRQDPRIDRLIITGGVGAGRARAIAVAEASGEFVAFLDDDDAWESDKIATQVAVARRSGLSRVVVATSVTMWSADLEATIVAPKQPYCDGPVQDYLFRRRVPSLARASLYTSTLLVPTSLARAVNWNPDLRRHQDWDWIVRLQGAGAEVLHVHKPLTRIHLGSAGSISASPNWAASLAWVSAVGVNRWARGTVSDFVVAQPLRYAIQARSLAGVMACLKVLLATRSLPSGGPVVFAVSGAVPRRLAERLALLRTWPARRMRGR